MTLLEQNNALQAIRSLLGVDAIYDRTERVSEVYNGQIVWEGDVHVFRVIGHPDLLCYVFSIGMKDPTKERVVTVLGEPPISNAHDAVRAGIVADYRSHKKE